VSAAPVSDAVTQPAVTQPAATGRLAAVLFDMDGTLIAGEELWAIALEELAASYGRRLSAAARIAMLGTDTGESMALFFADLGLDPPPGEVAAALATLEGRIAELYAEGVPWLPGAAELLAATRAAGLATALVTATSRPLVEVVLRSIGPAHFDAVVTGSDVTRPKPSGEPYAAAAAAVGAAPADCVAIEDSVNGMRSAIAAGCRVLVVPSEVPVAPGEGYTVMDTLDGVTVDDLAALIR
jgi:HAD superfamily hydrolase (TIGR01509 family)